MILPMEIVDEIPFGSCNFGDCSHQLEIEYFGEFEIEVAAIYIYIYICMYVYGVTEGHPLFEYKLKLYDASDLPCEVGIRS